MYIVNLQKVLREGLQRKSFCRTLSAVEVRQKIVAQSPTRCLFARHAQNNIKCLIVCGMHEANKSLLNKLQVTDINLVEGCGAEFAMLIEDLDRVGFHKFPFCLQGGFRIGDHCVADGNGIEQVGSSWLDVLDLRAFEPHGDFKSFVLHDLSEQQRIKGIGGRKDRPAKNRIAKVGSK